MTQITAVCDLGHNRKAKLPDGICIHLAITCNEIASAEIQNQQEIEMQKRQLGNSDLQITPGMERGRLEARAGNLPGARKAITTPSQQFIALSNWE